MARNKLASGHGIWKYFNPSYYLRRPRRLALLFILFVSVSFVVWDRRTLARDYQSEVSKLKSRQIKDVASCAVCGEEETIAHVLLHCRFAKSVWDIAPFHGNTLPPQATSLMETWKALRRKISLPPTGIGVEPLAAWIFWNLWVNRNKLIFKEPTLDAKGIITRASKEARDWSAAQLRDKECARAEDGIRTAASGDDCLVICRTDAAWKKEEESAGLGWVFLDREGNPISSHSATCRWVKSPLLAEGLAIRAALESAAAKGIRKLRLESDSQQLVSSITRGVPVADLHGVLSDIGYLSFSLAITSFNFISRRCNVIADNLAKHALALLDLG